MEARTAAGESRALAGDCGARGCRHLVEGVVAATHPPRILEVRSAVGESRALAGDCGARGCRHLVEGVAAANHLLHCVLGETFQSMGNPRSGIPRSDDGVTFGVVYPLEGIVLEHLYVGKLLVCCTFIEICVLYLVFFKSDYVLFSSSKIKTPGVQTQQ